MMTDLREVKLPTELCQKAEQLYGKRFGSLEQFLIFALQELTRDDATQSDQAEQKIIEERLKDLGYI
jgi:hypothetical protein